MPSRPPILAPLLVLSALVACNGSGFLQPTTGAIEITTTTSGQPDPDGYTIRIDDGNPVPIGADTTVTLPAFTTGLHVVDLGGLASGCSVQDGASRTVPVTQTDTARVTFAVACPTQLASRPIAEDSAEASRRGAAGCAFRPVVAKPTIVAVAHFP